MVSELTHSQKTGGEQPRSPETPTDIGVSFGKYLPKTIVTNQDIERDVGLPAAKIEEITGIRQRRITKPHETPFYMARAALDQALNGQKPDLLFVAISHPTEDLAERLSNEFGFNLPRTHRKNVVAACVGGVLGLSYVKQYEKSFMGANVAVVATEDYSPYLHDIKRGSKKREKTIFSAGSYAMSIPHYGEEGSFKIIAPPVVGFLHPKYRRAIEMGVDYTQVDKRNDIYIQIPGSESGKLEMDGRLVLNAIRDPQDSIAARVKQMLRNNMLKPTDIAYYIFHQGSGPVVEAIIQGLGPDFEGRVPRGYEQGNYSSASVLKVMDELNQQGKLKPGDKVGLHALGAGLYTANVFAQLGEAA